MDLVNLLSARRPVDWLWRLICDWFKIDWTWMLSLMDNWIFFSLLYFSFRIMRVSVEFTHFGHSWKPLCSRMHSLKSLLRSKVMIILDIGCYNWNESTVISKNSLSGSFLCSIPLIRWGLPLWPTTVWVRYWRLMELEESFCGSLYRCHIDWLSSLCLTISTFGEYYSIRWISGSSLELKSSYFELLKAGSGLICRTLWLPKRSLFFLGVPSGLNLWTYVCIFISLPPLFPSKTGSGSNDFGLYSNFVYMTEVLTLLLSLNSDPI